ncbi:MAG: sensor with HAMP domain protein, partial [Spirochaetia bacterium]
MESHSVVPLFPRSFPFCQFLQLKQSGKILTFWQEERGLLQLATAKERAEEMSRLKSQFLANMSHELR